MNLTVNSAPRSRFQVAHDLVEKAASGFNKIAANAMQAQMAGRPTSPAMLVAGVDQIQRSVGALLAEGLVLAPEAAPKVSAAQQALDGVISLVKQHAGDTTTVVSSHELSEFHSQFDPYYRAIGSVAWALNPGWEH